MLQYIYRNPLRKNHLIQRPTPAPPLLSHSEDRELDIAVQKLIWYIYFFQ